jgi:hypothetical protein
MAQACSAGRRVGAAAPRRPAPWNVRRATERAARNAPFGWGHEGPQREAPTLPPNHVRLWKRRRATNPAAARLGASKFGIGVPARPVAVTPPRFPAYLMPRIAKMTREIAPGPPCGVAVGGALKHCTSCRSGISPLVRRMLFSKQPVEDNWSLNPEATLTGSPTPSFPTWWRQPSRRPEIKVLVSLRNLSGPRVCRCGGRSPGPGRRCTCATAGVAGAEHPSFRLTSPSRQLFMVVVCVQRHGVAKPVEALLS